jgi:hypothetical protein
MAYPLQNYPSATSANSANELLIFPPTASNGPLPAYRGLSDWAAGMIAVTRDDWIAHGCCRLKKEKCAASATEPNPATVGWARRCAHADSIPRGQVKSLPTRSLISSGLGSP